MRRRLDWAEEKASAFYESAGSGRDRLRNRNYFLEVPKKMFCVSILHFVLLALSISEFD